MIVFNAKAKKGELDWGSYDNQFRLKRHLSDNEGKVYRLEKVETKRTLSQNAFYWAYLDTIERETGNLADYLHQYYKRLLLPPKFIQVMGKELKIPSSTTELNKTDFSEYMDKISADCGVAIPTEAELEAMGYISNHKPMSPSKVAYPEDNGKVTAF